MPVARITIITLLILGGCTDRGDNDMESLNADFPRLASILFEGCYDQD